MKRAPEGPEIRSKDRKGKKNDSAHAANSGAQGGMDPLEIAYGPTMGTHTKITEGDFDIDADHKADNKAMRENHSSPPGNQGNKGGNQNDNSNDDASPVREETGQWERSSTTDHADGTTESPFSIGGEDEFRNVWGK